MEKKFLISLLNEIFVPIGFKRKGNNWILDRNELIKVINLQKSNFSRSYYINYGYIIKALELTTFTHVENQLAGVDQIEQKLISDLLNLETNIATENRLSALKEVISIHVVTKIQSINTKNDLLKELQSRPHLNDISLTVKKYFQIA